MVNRTVRELIRARNKDGIAALAARASSIDPVGKSRAQIMALVCGADSAPAYRTYLREGPIALYNRYIDGIRSGLWSSTSSAANTMGVKPHRLAVASQIAALPEELQTLFPGGRLTFEIGRTLVDLVSVLGEQTMRERAASAQVMVPCMDKERLLNWLVGISAPEVKVKVERRQGERGEPGGLFLELHLDASDPETASRLEILTKLVELHFARKGENKYTERVVSARPVVVAPPAPAARGFVPLERLSPPIHLDGSIGTNRSAVGASSSARNDAEAVLRWLSNFEKSETRGRYRRLVEQLLLWAIVAKGKPLSSVDVDDANEYINQFLPDPQPSAVWTTKRGQPRAHPAWRPFRGPVSLNGRQKALSTLKQCFGDLVSCQYLVSNPFETVKIVGPGGEAELPA
jgi:hypothetical protein